MNNSLLLVNHWLEALASGDPDEVVAMYDEGAILVPTLENEPLHGLEDIREYFVQFMGSHPGLGGAVHEEFNQNLGEGRRAISGNYTFQWDRGSLDARFTFVIVDQGDDEWVIYTHHSSADPE